MLRSGGHDAKIDVFTDDGGAGVPPMFNCVIIFRLLVSSRLRTKESTCLTEDEPLKLNLESASASAS